jgi:hypothetical protein
MSRSAAGLPAGRFCGGAGRRFIAIHFHLVVIDGVFEPSDKEAGIVFFEATGLDTSTLAEVQATLRRRILKALVRPGLLAPEERATLEQWEHGGGFSIDAQVRIEG